MYDCPEYGVCARHNVLILSQKCICAMARKLFSRFMSFPPEKFLNQIYQNNKLALNTQLQKKERFAFGISSRANIKLGQECHRIISITTKSFVRSLSKSCQSILLSKLPFLPHPCSTDNYCGPPRIVVKLPNYGFIFVYREDWGLAEFITA